MNAAVTSQQLLALSQQQLDELFTSSPPGPIPNGQANGTAIIAPGTTYSADIARLINFFAWHGKVFDAAHGRLVNRILPFGINAIMAQVYVAPSWMDKKDCIVLDYSRRRRSRIGFATRYARLRRTFIWASSTGVRTSSSTSAWSFRESS